MFFIKDNISIIGAGWLGIPLANYLSNQHFNIQILKRTLPPDNLLKFWIKKDIDTENIPEISDSDVWIYLLPPTEMKKNLKRIEKIFSFSLPKKIILISSTHIYPDEHKIWKEEDIPAGGNAKTALEVTEKLFFETGICTILRCAGLVGPGRNPAYFMAGKKNIVKPLSTVNFVHQIDVIQAVTLILKEQNLSEIYNVCAPFHLSRQEFYTSMAQKYNLERPEFLEENYLGKVISGTKIVEKTCFVYQKVDFLNEEY